MAWFNFPITSPDIWKPRRASRACTRQRWWVVSRLFVHLRIYFEPPGGQGDSMLFGVSGFTLLVNGGYNRRSCFWDFIRHISRIDALLVSHLGPDSCYGLSSFFERKSIGKLHPDLGVVFMNVGDTKHLSPNGSTTYVSIKFIVEFELLIYIFKNSTFSFKYTYNEYGVDSSWFLLVEFSHSYCIAKCWQMSVEFRKLHCGSSSSSSSSI